MDNSLVNELDKICVNIMKDPKNIRKYVLTAYLLGSKNERTKIISLIQKQHYN